MPRAMGIASMFGSGQCVGREEVAPEAVRIAGRLRDSRPSLSQGTGELMATVQIFFYTLHWSLSASSKNPQVFKETSGGIIAETSWWPFGGGCAMSCSLDMRGRDRQPTRQAELEDR